MIVLFDAIFKETCLMFGGLLCTVVTRSAPVMDRGSGIATEQSSLSPGWTAGFDPVNKDPSGGIAVSRWAAACRRKRCRCGKAR